jgi:hypothetical protein
MTRLSKSTGTPLKRSLAFAGLAGGGASRGTAGPWGGSPAEERSGAGGSSCVFGSLMGSRRRKRAKPRVAVT